MAQKYPIDTDWFLGQLEKRNMNQSDLARHLNRHRSAVTHLLRGNRRMTAVEQDEIARIFGVSVEEVAAHRGHPTAGFEERKQKAYSTGFGSPAKDVPVEDLPDHPIFGCMAGTITVMPGVDLTEPMDFEWGEKLYNE